jgi:hypothetical protein
MSELESVPELDVGLWARRAEPFREPFGLRARRSEVALGPVEANEQTARASVVGMLAKPFGEKLFRLLEAPAVHEQNGFPIELGLARGA